MSLPILPTSVIGSYSMPEWLERAKNDYLSRRVSKRDLDEMHDAVRKAALKDQEVPASTSSATARRSETT
jgi:5-methyltetrahydropteroyltriglutamate--homocysteine methyltransferase